MQTYLLFCFAFVLIVSVFAQTPPPKCITIPENDVGKLDCTSAGSGYLITTINVASFDNDPTNTCFSNPRYIDPKSGGSCDGYYNSYDPVISLCAGQASCYINATVTFFTKDAPDFPASETGCSNRKLLVQYTCAAPPTIPVLNIQKKKISHTIYTGDSGLGQPETLSSTGTRATQEEDTLKKTCVIYDATGTVSTGVRLTNKNTISVCCSQVGLISGGNCVSKSCNGNIGPAGQTAEFAYVGSKDDGSFCFSNCFSFGNSMATAEATQFYAGSIVTGVHQLVGSAPTTTNTVIVNTAATPNTYFSAYEVSISNSSHKKRNVITIACRGKARIIDGACQSGSYGCSTSTTAVVEDYIEDTTNEVCYYQCFLQS